MKKTKQKSKPKRRRVQFAFDAHAARKVYLAGDFNDWSETAYPMKKNADGTWRRSVLLVPGQYEYKFLVDNDWRVDPANPKRHRNRFGTYNSLIEVA